MYDNRYYYTSNNNNEWTLQHKLIPNFNDFINDDNIKSTNTMLLVGKSHKQIYLSIFLIYVICFTPCQILIDCYLV
jgi:hypothetical protein